MYELWAGGYMSCGVYELWAGGYMSCEIRGVAYNSGP